MEKYRHMGLSEDEAKIHLKREKRAEKIERERRLQIEAEDGFRNFSTLKIDQFSVQESLFLRRSGAKHSTRIWKPLKDKRKAEILSKIMNEEKDLERRKIQNPTLFMTNEHLLPRPSDTLGQFLTFQ